MAIRQTQLVVEVLNQIPNPNVRVTQVHVEVLTRRGAKHSLTGPLITAPVRRVSKRLSRRPA